MDDLKNELERAARHYAPPPDALGRLDDKKARSGRNDKVGAMVVGLAIVGALIFAFVTIGTQKGTVQPAAGGSDDVAATPVNGDLLYSKSAEPATWHIFSYDPATGKETQLTTGSRTYGSDWSPDGTQIVYDHERPLGYEEIVIANADGSDPRTVASGQDPAWSPDGTEIAYVEDSRIWVVNTDGTNPHHVTTPGSDPDAQSYEAPYDRNPAWSPDGTAIAYTRIAAFGLVPRPSGNGQAQVSREELRVWHENGPDEVLTSDCAALGEVDWSPDGSTLVFTGGPTLFDQSGMTDGLIWPRVLTMPSGGGEVTPLTPDNQTWAAGVTWSPDGTLIAYVDDNHALVTMWPDGTHRHDLGIDPGGDAIIGPSWGVAAPSPSP